MEVVLHVYDLSPFNKLTSWLGLGAFHSGIEVGGYEYTYVKSGKSRMQPKDMPACIVYRCSVPLGLYEGTNDDLGTLLNEMRDKFPRGGYNMVTKNCNDFSAELSQRLVGTNIPSWVNRAALFVSCCCTCCFRPTNDLVDTHIASFSLTEDGCVEKLHSQPSEATDPLLPNGLEV